MATNFKSKNRYIIFFTCGIAAGIAAISLSILLKVVINAPFLPDIASQALISLTSGQIESQAVSTLGPLAKYSSFFGATITNIILYGIIGIFLGFLLNKIGVGKYYTNLATSIIISYLISILIMVFFIILNTPPGQAISILPISIFLLLPSNIVYGILIFYLYGKRTNDYTLSSSNKLAESKLSKSDNKEYTNINYERRAFIRSLIISAIAIPIIYFGFNRLFSKPEQQQQDQQFQYSNIQRNVTSQYRSKGFEDPRLTPLIDGEVTPTYLFYRIDKNAIVPSINSESWNLTIKGQVKNPFIINYEEIKALKNVEEYATLACISNKLGGNLTSTALWKGVLLKDILLKAQPLPNAKYIVFRCFDGYDVGIPIENGMMDGTLLAYEMNNQPLTNEHGFPVRAIVPGFYGMMNPKWITEIELVDQTYEGFWQRKGWTNNGIKNIISSIVIPGSQSITDRFPHIVKDNNFMIDKNIPIAGIAFAGDRGISKIEVSTDGGNTWKSAIVKDPLSNYTWVLWTSGFIPKDKGEYKIIVRATDKTGKIQTSEFADPFPNGVEGYNSININV